MIFRKAAAPAMTKPNELSKPNNGGIQGDVFNFLKELQTLEDIRTAVRDEIMPYLTPEQQETLDSLLARRQALVTNVSTVLVALSLDGIQQQKVMQEMLICQQEIWSLVANVRLPWEQRLQRMRQVNTLQRISAKMTMEQKGLLNNYILLAE